MLSGSGRGRSPESAAATRCQRFALSLSPQLALQMPRELPNGREVEQLGEIHQPRVLVIDPLMNFDELERAGADLEQVVVHADALALHGRIADRLQLVFDLRERAGLGGAATLRHTKRRQLLELSVEFA